MGILSLYSGRMIARLGRRFMEEKTQKTTKKTVEKAPKVADKASKGELAQFDSYAIFQTGGKQYQAVKGQTIGIEKLEGEDGAKIEFKDVLFRKTGDKQFEFGKPHLETPVKASIVKQTKGPKLVVFNFKRRKKVRVKKGHRQPITVVRIESI